MKKRLFITSILILALFLGGCSISIKSKSGGGNDGGVYISPNKGEVWKQMVMVPSIDGRTEDIGFINVNSLEMDPNDSAAVYLASDEFGLYYTYNVTKGWNKVEQLGSNTIIDVEVDPQDKCKVYVTLDNKLMRTTDCNRTWQQLYLAPNQEFRLSAVAIDHFNTSHIYIATSAGDLIKSIDNGRNWRTIQRFNNPVSAVVINPEDSREVYVATSKNELYRFNSDSNLSYDELSEFRNRLDGTNWKNIREDLDDYDIGDSFVSLEFASNGQDIIWASNKGLVRSPDGGLSWLPISLLTPPDETNIKAMALNPDNAQEIYYGTNSVFVKSVDGGNTWSVTDLPSSRVASDIVIDHENTDLLYLSVKRAK
ncbi:MAG: WD40/YVTN/BNR-like repeat-containing protein [Parcubacteria group bacterium]